MNRKPVTIYDVAKAAKVSPSTVSRALSHPGRLAMDTELRIRNVAKSLGYLDFGDKPDWQPRHTKIVTAVIPDYLNRTYEPLMTAMQKTLGARQFSLVVLQSDITRRFDRQALSQLIHISNGLIVVSSLLSEPDLLRYAMEVPTVTVNAAVTGVSGTVSDLQAAVSEAMAYLYATGHRSVTYLAGASTSWFSETYRRNIRTASYRYDTTYHVLHSFTSDYEGGEEAVSQFLAQPTDAVFAYNNQLATGFINGAKKAGMRVPDDLSVIGFGNDEAAMLSSPALSVIEPHAKSLGRQAATILLEQIGSSRRHTKTISITSSFNSRKSVSSAKRRLMKLGPYAKPADNTKRPTVLTMLSSSFNETMPRINTFMKENPDIVVDPIEGHTQESTMNLYWERLQSGQPAPDLFNVEYDKMPQFAASGALLDIGNETTEHRWSREFNPSVWQSAHFAGRLYGLPGDQSQTVMFYRQDLLRKYHLALPATWQQFYEEGIRLHRQNPNRYMGIIDTTDVQHYLSFFRMADAKPWSTTGTSIIEFTLDDPRIAKTAAFIQRCIDDGVLNAEPLWDGKYSLPHDGKYVTIVYANWFGKIIATSYPQDRDLWKVALPPAFNDGRLRTAEIGGSMLTISSGLPSSHRDAALRFVHWFQSAPRSVDMRTAGGYSATKYFEEKSKASTEVDSYFNQPIYPIYEQSSQLVNHNWDCLPFASYLGTLFKQSMIPQLRPGMHSPDVLKSWQTDLMDYAKSQGFQTF